MFHIIGHSQGGPWDTRRQKLLERGLAYWADPKFDLEEKFQSFYHQQEVNAEREEARLRKKGAREED